MTISRFRFILTVALGVGCVGAAVVLARPANPQRGDGAMGGLGITIFADANFHGINSNFRTDVPDLRKYSMNDRVDSLQIARGEIWEVCVDINYKGRCQVFSGDDADLGRVGWGGMISSLRKLNDNDPRGRGRGETPSLASERSRMVLFDTVEFGGQAFTLADTSMSLRALNNRAGSVKVYGGAWELCDGDRFQGHCATVTSSVSDLTRIGLRDKVRSARPVARGR